MRTSAGGKVESLPSSKADQGSRERENDVTKKIRSEAARVSELVCVWRGGERVARGRTPPA
jgi:hypothetical protein